MERDNSRPLMLCATTVLNPGPARIGRLGGGLTLPRTVEIRVLVAAGIGVAVGVLLASLLGMGFRGLILLAALGAAAGWLAISYSPMKGESLGIWAALEVRSRLRSIDVDGEPATVYVGICRVPDVAAGKVRIIPGAINVTEGSVDERGRFIARQTPFSSAQQLRGPGPQQRPAPFPSTPVAHDRPPVPPARPPHTPPQPRRSLSDAANSRSGGGR